MPEVNFHQYPEYLDDNGPTGYERIPARPLADQPVTVLAALTGCSAGTDVVLTVNGHEHSTIAGLPVRDKDGRRFFSFALGSFPASAHVEYRLMADGASSRLYAFDVAAEETVESFAGISCETGCLHIEAGNPWLKELFLSFQDGALVLSVSARAGDGVFVSEDGQCRFTDGATGVSVTVRAKTGELDIVGPDGQAVMAGLTLALHHTATSLTGVTLRYGSGAKAVLGLGERFNGVNQIGRKVGCSILERFTNQGKSTYFPVPFFLCDDGYGVHVDTLCRTEYDFGASERGRFTIDARVAQGRFPDVRVFFGQPADILGCFTALTGRAPVPPSWAFGVWISANRWNRQRHIEEQIAEADAAKYPVDVAVIEAWSDESTFYIWNGAQYDHKPGAESFSADEFRYQASGPWPDPAGLVRRLHERGTKLVLWQIPVLKKLGSHEPANPQHAEDTRYAADAGLVATDSDGNPYAVPDFWFCGSHLPDFTKREAIDWWFAKRSYLLDMGVDGFKTDGGEFVFGDDCRFAGGTQEDMKNGFTEAYLSAYGTFAGPDRVLFSRAGFMGSQRHPMHWAGDQESTWEELRNVLSAGLSLGLSGEPYWSFDIGGFAGPLPSPELYRRATELAAFVPAMQWHSNVLDDGTKGPTGVNDRSPWNMARATGDDGIVGHACHYAWLHENLRPYLVSEAQKSARTGLPMMRHLALAYPDDHKAYETPDQFLLGDLLVTPVLTPGATSRTVWLPEGRWTDLWTGEDITGGRTVDADAPQGRIPLYLRHGGLLALRLGHDGRTGEPIPADGRLFFLLGGPEGKAEFFDESHVRHEIIWMDGKPIGGSPEWAYTIAGCGADAHLPPLK